jgi:hypothetical protein
MSLECEISPNCILVFIANGSDFIMGGNTPEGVWHHRIGDRLEGRPLRLRDVLEEARVSLRFLLEECPEIPGKKLNRDSSHRFVVFFLITSFLGIAFGQGAMDSLLTEKTSRLLNSERRRLPG